MRQLAVIVPLLALLGLALWFIVYAWTAIDAPPLPAGAWIALAGGIIVSLLLGIGLMALLFYSHRHGYDEIDDRTHRKPPFD